MKDLSTVSHIETVTVGTDTLLVNLMLDKGWKLLNIVQHKEPDYETAYYVLSASPDVLAKGSISDLQKEAMSNRFG